MKAIANILMICLCTILIYAFMQHVLGTTEKPEHIVYAPLKQQFIRDTVEITSTVTPPEAY